MTGDGVAQRLRRSRQSVKIADRRGYEDTRISIEGTENSLYFVAPYVFLERGICIGVDIIRPDNNPIFRGWNRERASAGHDVGNCFTWLEEGSDAPVFVFESRIPVHFREVEAEFAVGLGRNDFGIRGAREELHRESAVGGPGAHILDLINDGGDEGIFVEDEICKEVLVGEARVAEVNVSDVANLGENGGTRDVLRED